MTHGKTHLVYYFCRLQLPALALPSPRFATHLERMFEIYRTKNAAAAWEQFLAELYALDSFLTIGCLENQPRAWETLFAARAGRADRLLVDALRARAVRLFPRDEEKQDSAVTDFWGHLIVSETPGSVPILARYDGQRPLIPWLIRVFQNWQISNLRSRDAKSESLVEDDMLPERDFPSEPDTRWHECFCDAARAWLKEVTDHDLLLLGLRLRYRQSQREVATLLGVHEGTISRQITQVRDRCLEAVGQKLIEAGWTGDDLSGFVYNEMNSLLMDEPRLSAENLARMLGKKGKQLPASGNGE
jgi:RNA polymerase sigma factor (sigma-70 family)